jgi:hypothetical protein
MAAKKLTDFDPAAALSDTDEFGFVQGDVNVHEQLGVISDFISAKTLGKADTAELIRDTIANALVAGTNITITVNDAGDQITIDAAGGSAGGNIMWYWLPPAAADFPTTVTEGTATLTSFVDDSDLGLMLAAKPGAADNFYGKMRAAPAYPFTITAHFTVTAEINDTLIQGIVLRNSLTGLRTVFGADAAGGKGGIIIRRTTGVTFNANLQVTTEKCFPTTGLWLRVVATAEADISYQISGDGKNWIEWQANTANGQVAGMDQIGIGITTRGGTFHPGFINCDYWNVA